MSNSFLFQYTTEFGRQMVAAAREIVDWEPVLTHFGIHFVPAVEGGVYFLSCPSCHNSNSITLWLNKHPFPKFKCMCGCESNYGGQSYVSLIHLFNDADGEKKSPTQILDEIRNTFIGNAQKARRARSGRIKPTRPAPGKKQTGRVKKTPAKSSRKDTLASAIYRTMKN